MAERKPKIKYNYDLLVQTIQRDNATLVGEYKKINRDTRIQFSCNCGIEHNKIFKCILKQGGAYCTSCSEKLAREKLKKSMLDKYGVEHAFQDKDCKEKAKKTMLERYGTEHAMKSKEIQEKTKKTILEKYGVENLSQSNEIQKKIKENSLQKYGVEHPRQLKEIQEKAKKTMLDKYGAEYSLQVDKFKEKAKKTTLERFGVENVSQNQFIKEKKKRSCLKHFGVEYSFQSEEVQEKSKKTMILKYNASTPLHNKDIKEKIKQTNIEKYGVENPMQCKEIQEKSSKNSKKFKDYKMPSGEVRRVQGYEPFALDELLKIYTEDQLKTARKDVPRVQYLLETKKHYYFPDIFIPHENKIIEVKSTYTIQCNPKMIKCKEQACKDKGYTYELWIFNDKGQRVNL